jgi:hypothetical protein
MLRAARSAAVARLAAALTALALSGAPQVLATQAPAERHRCSCCHAPHAGGEHECECAQCRKAALSAQASDASQPPCHRAAAKKALSAGSRRHAPCLEGTCGAGTRQAMTVAGAGPFCLLDAGAVVLTLAPEVLGTSTGAALDRAVEPAKPRPRAA